MFKHQNLSFHQFIGCLIILIAVKKQNQNLKLGLDLEDITKAYKDQLIIKYERVNVTESPVLKSTS